MILILMNILIFIKKSWRVIIFMDMVNGVIILNGMDLFIKIMVRKNLKNGIGFKQQIKKILKKIY